MKMKAALFGYCFTYIAAHCLGNKVYDDKFYDELVDRYFTMKKNVLSRGYDENTDFLSTTPEPTYYSDESDEDYYDEEDYEKEEEGSKEDTKNETEDGSKEDTKNEKKEEHNSYTIVESEEIIDNSESYYVYEGYENCEDSDSTNCTSSKKEIIGGETIEEETLEEETLGEETEEEGTYEEETVEGDTSDTEPEEEGTYEEETEESEEDTSEEDYEKSEEIQSIPNTDEYNRTKERKLKKDAEVKKKWINVGGDGRSREKESSEKRIFSKLYKPFTISFSDLYDEPYIPYEPKGRPSISNKDESSAVVYVTGSIKKPVSIRDSEFNYKDITPILIQNISFPIHARNAYEDLVEKRKEIKVILNKIDGRIEELIKRNKYAKSKRIRPRSNKFLARTLGSKSVSTKKISPSSDLFDMYQEFQ